MEHPNLNPERLEEAKRRLYSEVPPHPASDLLAWQSTVIFSPHPDDESLGCGGLISQLGDYGKDVRVVFVTDGSMSHPNSTKFPPEARAALRREEARKACSLLGVGPDRVFFLALPDGQVPSEWEPTFSGVVSDLVALIAPWGVDTFVVPWRRDPHEDHRATWEICRSAANRLEQPLRWVEYPVWMWEARNLVDLPREEEVIGWGLEIENKLAVKEAAIRAHASQWLGVIDDDPAGFQLPEEMIAKFLRPREVYFVPPDKRYRSLDSTYFDEVYRDGTDPWNFETSAYERDKYAATLAALPDARYRRALEIGSSIGVLSEGLAARCDALVGVDPVAKALDVARARLQDHPAVSFLRMSVPDDFPDGAFDLVVVSEVGYYWSRADLEKAIDLIGKALEPGGVLLLVHYTPYVPDYPLTGDEVHEAFNQRLTGFYRVRADRADRYRLDVWRKERADGHSA
ncbi:LmbE family N-acetylglucosaminyl deacetylase [Neolewinella xylanilytica]|uniref:LmbE family N-acetylglucosaminyl deacetylase n=1 Tax=Neolewinella xylanilytica TaxID=1514080 RepID=A0A2S6IA14_9BACT|nr:bifunctional PIG-L family deacetylase/class I SAM-dependent methyltransferase [Neolewinella xylanilytica]PPK88322.1 LmbE family N-acetylglucosaminyl deacetylase [Neolewinella xylanilytica]